MLNLSENFLFDLGFCGLWTWSREHRGFVCVFCVFCACALCVWPHAQHLPQIGVYLTEIGYPSTSSSGKSKFHLSYYQQIKLCWIIKAQIAFRCCTSHHWCWHFSLLLAIQFWVIFAWSLRCSTGCVLTTVALLWTFAVYERLCFECGMFLIS